MEEREKRGEERATSGASLKWWHLLLLAVGALVVGITIFYISVQRKGKERAPAKERLAVVPEGSRAVTLFFADRDNEALVSETRQVAIGKDFTEQVKQVVAALLEGPEDSGVRAVPEGTTVLDVFYDSDTSVLYLDFSSDLVSGHPGGSSAEYYTIAAIMRTVSENFPEVKAVQFLVEGLQVGTIGGHIDAYRPFSVRDWR